MGPGAGHPTSKLTESEIVAALRSAKRFHVDCSVVDCDLFKRRKDDDKSKIPADIIQQFTNALKRIESLEKQLADLKLKEGSAGKDGVDGKPGAEGKPGRDGADGKTPPEAELLALIRRIVDENKAELKGKDGADGEDCVVDYDKIIAEVLKKIPTPTPLPSREPHVVIVADKNGDYWSRLSSEIEHAKGYFSAVRVADPPAFSVPLPQLVVYVDGKPAYRSSGLRNVSNDLQRMVRGDFEPVNKPAL